MREQRSSSYNRMLVVAVTDPALAEDRPERDALGADWRSFDRVRAVKAKLAAVSEAPANRRATIAKAKLTAASDTDPEFREMLQALQSRLPPHGASRG